MLDPKGFDLPQIPTKRYFAIGEVSVLCAVKPHVLRYWEQEFPQLQPLKRRGNRRYYQRHEVKLIRQIKQLLYSDGFTISGARARLQQLAAGGDSKKSPASERQSTELFGQIITELKEVCDMLK